jgi:DNA-binding transcriptional LysR family regulator
VPNRTIYRVINDPELVINAALEGIGVAYLYEEYVASLVANGHLVSLLENSVLPTTEGFFLFYPSQRQNPAALRAFIEFLRTDLRKQHAPLINAAMPGA